MIAENMTEEGMRKEIEENLSLNMFVEAGAGAGKTTLIVSRIVNMLKRGVEPGEIVVITFTNAAAEELRARIIKKVDEKAKNDQGLKDKLNRLNDMNISTIHSFCNVLLHEQGLMTKLPIDLEMLQGEEEIKEKREYFDAFLKTLNEDDWKKLEANMGNKGSRYTIRQNMEALYGQMADLPEDTDIKIPKPANVAGQKQALAALRSAIFGDPSRKIPTLSGRILKELNSCVNPEKKKEGEQEAGNYEEAAEKYCGKGKAPYSLVYEEVLSQNHSVATENKVYGELLKTKEYTFLAKSNFKTIIDTEKIQEANARISSEINQILKDELRGLLPTLDCKDEDGNVISYEEALRAKNEKGQHGITLAEYAKKAREYYRKYAKRNRITNDRLLELTRDLILNKDTSALEYFSKKYTRFFVDEFQDTDRIQESFIYRLASTVEDETKLRDGALFVVGDPKQSIYRFRGAQPEVYFATKEKMELLDNAKVYSLQYNYRSVEEVVELWVNKKFNEAEEYTPIVNMGSDSYSYTSMIPQKKAIKDDKTIKGIYHVGYPDAEQGPFSLTIKGAKGEKKYDVFMYNESEPADDIKKVVDLILDLTKKNDKGEGYFKITDYDEKRQPYSRDIKLSDFLLISHNKKMMEDYVTAMKKSGIPVVLDGEEDLKADKGLVVFVRLYQYLVNPRDSFYRTGAEEALRETLHIKSEKELRELSLRILDCLYEDAKSMSAYGMAEYLERQVSLLFDKNTDVSHVETISTQTHIRQMIENLCMNVTGSGIEMAEAMQKYLATKLEHELSLDEKPDAVRFMNLHKTKGLEGNIVIILDRRGKKDYSPSKCMDGKDYYPGKDKFWTSLEDYPDIKEKAEKSEEAEFHRLEYVAVTRASQAVIFMDVIKKNGLFAKKKLVSPLKKEDKEGLGPEYQGNSIYTKQDEKTYSYNIRAEKNIREWINGILPKERQENKSYVAKGNDYDIKQDAYPNVQDGQEVKTEGMIIKESPSHLEKGSSPTKSRVISAAKKAGHKKSEEYDMDALRPIGNVAGDILHRSMELLVGRKFMKSDISITSSVCQAVEENSDRLCAIQEKLRMDLEKEGYSEEAKEITEEKTKEIVTKFMTACAKEYDSYLDGFWQDVVNVYPEVHFSYEMKNEEAGGVQTWMNGTADLILEMNDGTYRLIDYKSDNDYLMSEEAMNQALSEKYTPQLDVYRGVIQTMLSTVPEKITTGIISFSQKDSSGKLLSAGNVRVRYTQLDGSNA